MEMFSEHNRNINSELTDFWKCNFKSNSVYIVMLMPGVLQCDKSLNFCLCDTQSLIHYSLLLLQSQ